MIKELQIENKIVRIYCTNKNKDKLPVIILNHYSDDTNKVFDECIKLKCNDFILITISNLDWDNDMTPYYLPKLYKNGNDYLGYADKYIKLLEDKIIPSIKEYIENELKIQIEYYSMIGYSLAGLFSIYSNYKTNMFKRVASVSGSLWYPKFKEFIKENNINNKIEKIYFSLGNKESKTKNQILMTVENNTKEIEEFYKEKGIKTIYELNEGNHFQDSELRIAKSIKWILE